MNKPRLRIYTDTSVIGGCYDSEFARDSLHFMELVRRERVILLLSAVVIQELEDAPREVQAVLTSLSPSAVEIVPLMPEIARLRDA
jgi:GTPase SAR1 family protein